MSPEGKRTLGRHKCRWHSNTIEDVRKLAWGVNGITLLLYRYSSVKK
jgi:hypothetical protein